jgi:AraC-like DNA-binding protein/quercetin dioxygenase-like cupin family protein
MRKVVDLVFAQDARLDRSPGPAICIESHPARPAYSADEHSHERDSLFLVVAGKGYCVVEGCEYALGPMMSLFLPAGVNHSLVDKPRSAMTIFVVTFDGQIAHKQEKLLALLQAHTGPQCLPVHVWQDLRRLLRQMLHEQNLQPPHYEVALDNLLASVVLLLSRAYSSLAVQKIQGHRSSTQRVRQVLDHVADTYYQNHSLPEAARVAGLSQRRFSSLCKDLCACSFIHFVNGVRVERARHLLETTRLPVAAVAFQVGFEEISTFYRAFRKHAGSSPRQIEKMSPMNL